MRTYLTALVCLFFIFSAGINSTYASDYGGGYDDDNWNSYNRGNDDDDDHHNHHGDDDDDNNNDIPLDGGLSFLALAGAGLGIKKVRDGIAKNKKENK